MTHIRWSYRVGDTRCTCCRWDLDRGVGVCVRETSARDGSKPRGYTDCGGPYDPYRPGNAVPGRPEPSSKDVPASQSEAKSDCLTQRTPTAI